MANPLGYRPHSVESPVPVPSKTPLLDLVKTPADLRRLESSQLRQLADELRQETVDAVAVTGGHLGAGLGVIDSVDPKPGKDGYPPLSSVQFLP